MGANGFLGGLLRRDAHEDVDDPGTHHHPGKEFETGRRRSARRGTAPREGHHQPPPPRGLTVERLAGAIADLPPDVPRQSAVLIVRKALDAAGVELSEVDESTREQEARLSHEIGLVENRQKELREKTQETVRSLEEEITKTLEACDEVVAYEERKISRDRALLGEVRRVRTFFELFGAEGGEEDAGQAEVEELPGPTERGTQQIREPLDAAKARRMRDFFGLSKAEGEEGAGPAEVEGEEDAGPAERGTQQSLGPSDVMVRRRIFEPPFGPGAGGG